VQFHLSGLVGCSLAVVMNDVFMACMFCTCYCSSCSAAH